MTLPQLSERERLERRLIAAFKRGVLFRDTTNAPVPDDKAILEKLAITGIWPPQESKP